MAEYSHEKTGPIAELLNRADAYHYQSSKMTDILCAGYADYDRSKESDLGKMIEVQLDCRLKYFFPEKFHELRRLINKNLGKKWNYEGGVDLILFPTTGDSEKPIDWRHAAIVRSQKHVGVIFKDVDQMVRTIINLNEEYKGHLHPDQLRPDITDRVIRAKILGLAEKVGPDVIHKAIEFFAGKPA